MVSNSNAALNNCFIFLDIDECIEKIDNCEVYCTNIPGSYSCTCDVGFELINTTYCTGKTHPVDLKCDQTIHDRHQ